MVTSPALEIRNLSYGYRGNWLVTRHEALHDIDLVVNEGETFGFLGHNGAGKTTTIKAILNLIRPWQGRISIFGVSSLRVESRRHVGYLPEQPYFYDHLTVLEMMQLYASLAGVPRSEITLAVQRALDRVRMTERARIPMRSLSKGLTQRVALAQAIVAEPKLLILDEPFSGLDPLGRREFRDVIEQLRLHGMTIFMSSHILSDVELLCDRISIMVKGRLKGVYSIHDLPGLTAPRYEMVLHNFEAAKAHVAALAVKSSVKSAALVCLFAGREQADRALRIALDGGCQVDAFQPAHSSLEELFMKLVREEAVGDA